MGRRAEDQAVLDRAMTHALRRLESAPTRRVPATGTADDAVRRLGGELPVAGQPGPAVVGRLAAAVEPGLMANASGRFFGWVMGSSLPAAVAADWLVSAWDQNAGTRDATPGVVAAEEVAAGEVAAGEVAAAWLLQLVSIAFESDQRTREVFGRLLAEGLVMPSAGVWRGCAVIRFSVNSWRTGLAEVRETVEAVARASRQPERLTTAGGE
jgi:hypothetical protein